MTRRKAIEAAVDRGWVAYESSGLGVRYDANLLAKKSAARAYDMGRIAGLREAATMAAANGNWTPTIDDVQRKARGLAKALKQS